MTFNIKSLFFLFSVFGNKFGVDAAAYGPRLARQQCLVTSDEIRYSTDKKRNPIFGGGGFVGRLTLDECKHACDTKSDSHNRPCVAFEWSDSGNTLVPNESRNCALAWGCSSTSGWGGGSVFMKEQVGVQGDPHFKTWAGESFDFHGVCDLLLLKKDGFDNSAGLEIHMRTTRMRRWSFVSVAAIRIGSDILEVRGGDQSKNENFWINGILGGDEELSNQNKVSKIMTLSGKYPVLFNRVSKKQQNFVVGLGGEEKIVISTWNSFVRIQFEDKNGEHFKNSVGLMGSYPGGVKLARDNITVLEDLNDFGQEWQIQNDLEQKLFRVMESPQYPEKCIIPSGLEMRRRLGEAEMHISDAKNACVDVNEDVLDLCVFDVMATNNRSTAGAY